MVLSLRTLSEDLDEDLDEDLEVKMKPSYVLFISYFFANKVSFSFLSCVFLS